MRTLIAAAVLLGLTACGLNGTDEDDEETAERGAAADQSGADSMASRDPGPGEMAQADIPDPEQRPIMQAQVVLDRRGFGPGVIDGRMGISTANAISGFQEANNLEVTGELDEPTTEGQLLVRALDPELVWLAHEHEPWRPRTA